VKVEASEEGVGGRGELYYQEFKQHGTDYPKRSRTPAQELKRSALPPLSFD